MPSENMKVSFFTLGCKVNQYETQVLKNEFYKQGYDVVSDSDFSDVYVINSCTVTAVSDKKTRKAMKRMRNQNPDAIIALTGCMPQAFPHLADELDDVQVISGAKNRKKLLENIKNYMLTGERIVDIAEHNKDDEFEKMSLEGEFDKTRAFVKIQDGCDRYCTYCIIPKARGFVRSKSIADIKEEVTSLVQSGYSEIVLVGINLCLYGKGEEIRLIDAIETVCNVDGVKRVRLGSLEPELILDEDIERMSKLEQFCPQFHLSLQSGCDETLKRMNRHYDTAFYSDLANKLNATFADCAITTDIMVGFPGETPEEFEQTLKFAEDMKLAKVHIFAYSPRAGTKAAQMQQISSDIKSKRSNLLKEVTDKTRTAYMEKYLGKSLDVLFENTVSKNGILGHTKNYIAIYVKNAEDYRGTIHKVKITKVCGEYCLGELEY